MQVTAYAICAKGLTTHLEHKAIAGIATRKNPYTQDSLTCASGELLTGGYQITASPSLVGVSDDSPLNDITRSEANGSIVQNWYVAVASSGWQAHVSPGQIWITCLDAPGSATPTTQPTTQPTATAHAPRPTSTPKPRPTATPRPRPTNTPVASCVSLYSGTGTMTVDKTYLNVNSSTGIGITSSGAQAQWNTTTALAPVNGAGLADLGVIGASGFNGVTCAKLKSASYIARLIPATKSGEVFLVKTTTGQYAKVLITLTPSALASPPTLTWKTYKP